MGLLIQRLKISLKYTSALVKWLIIAGIVGIAGGFVGSMFHISIDAVTYLRGQHGWLLLLLPLGGVVIAWLYSLCRKCGKLDTNRVLDSVRDDGVVPLLMIPLIFVGSVITHLLGGSAGREGAALQLGGAIGYKAGRILRLKGDDIRIVVMAGMSAVFTALFGTPLAASVFAIEVTSVGLMHYAALLPCIFSSLIALSVSAFVGVSPVHFSLSIPLRTLSPKVWAAIVLLSIMCALVSIVFCTSIKQAEHYAKKLLPSTYLRAVLGGLLIVVLTFISGTKDYNGAGMNVIERALSGDARYEAFALKIIFTAITVAAGFKGGEIVPAFFVGSVFGCCAAPFLGIPASLGAAIGFIALFCGAVNCPVASVFLALEVFGADHILVFAGVCAVSYMMSGNYGLYKSQKIIYSKLSFEHIDADAR